MLVAAEDTAMDYAEVSDLLWRQRDALETVTYKLVTEQLMVAAGKARWLSAANRELELALDNVRGLEVLRGIEVAAVSEHLGFDREPTLNELAASAPEPWASVLTDHHHALSALVAQIAQLVAENQRLLAAGVIAIRETLASVGPVVGIYDVRATVPRNEPALPARDDSI